MLEYKGMKNGNMGHGDDLRLSLWQKAMYKHNFESDGVWAGIQGRAHVR